MDSNAVVRTPTEAWVWLAPDWSTSVLESTVKADPKKKPAGATLVLTRTSLYNDGRKVTVVLDKDGEPVGADGQPTAAEAARVLKSETDPEQQRIFNADAAAERAANPKQTPDQAAITASQATDARREQAEKEKNAAWPAGQDPRYETDKERADRAAATRKEQEATGRQQDTTVVGTEYVGTGRNRKKVTTYQSGRKVTEDAATDATATGVIYEADGTKVTTYDDGHTTREQRTPEQARAEREATQASRLEEQYVNPADHKTYIKVTTKDPTTGQGKVTYLDPQTRAEVTLPGSAMAGVKGVPSYTPDLTRPGAGLIDRAKQLDELLAAGTITWEQRQEILKGDQTLASTIANEFNAGATVLRETFQSNISQRGQDITNSQSRAALANTHLTNALGMVEKFGPYLGATPGDAGKLFRGLIAGQLAQATAYGGMKDFPREQQDPALTAWAQRAVSGAAGTPAAAPGAPAGGPNALGLGAIGAVPAPGATAPGVALPPPLLGPPPAVTGSVAAPTSGPGGPPTAGEPGGPPLAPGPVWQPPSITSDAGFYPPWGQGPDTTDPGFHRPDMQGPDTTDPGFHRSDMGSPATQGAIGRALPNLTADSWRGAAQQQASQFDPTWTPEGGDDFGTSVGQPLLALDSAIPGLTPDLDKEARRQLDMALAGGRIGR